MEPLAILQADRLDLLFENRNKAYGAYPLRKFYHRRMLAAMATVLAVVLIFSCCVMYVESKTDFSGQVFVGPDVYLSAAPTVNPVVNAPVPLKPSTPARHVATANVAVPVIVRDQLVREAMVTVDEIDRAAVGTHNEAGPELAPGDNGPAGASGTAGTVVADSMEAAPAIYEVAEVMPEFPGGQEALKRFLLKNLRMPETGLDPGSQVKVVARFVVGPDGKVDGIETVLSGGAAFDGEVKRVIGRMPGWKPGMQHHKKVAVYFNLPVSFVVPQEN